MPNVRLIHLHSACPRCKSGIMTPYSIINYQEGIPKMHLIDSDEKQELNNGEFILTICSLEQCGYTEQIASPNTLYNHKKNSKIQKHLKYSV